MTRGLNVGASCGAVGAVFLCLAVATGTVAGCTSDASSSSSSSDAGAPASDAAAGKDAAIADSGGDAEAGRDAQPVSDASTCSADQTRCGGECVNADRDNANCGSCGHSCGAGEVCSLRQCDTTCGGGLVLCAMDAGATDAGSDADAEAGAPAAAPYCANEVTDNANCGGCGITCGAGEVCSDGACKTTCSADLVECHGSCINPSTDLTYCGATNGCDVDGGTAGTTCTAGLGCSGGTCVRLGCAPGSITIPYSGATTTFVVPGGCGLVTIEADGAEGASDSTFFSALTTGGLGARIVGTVAVGSGEQLRVLVGGKGFSDYGAGGGGGTFVTRGDGSPLVIAGGGGGAGLVGPGQPGEITSNGDAVGDAPGGTNGSGGSQGIPGDGNAGCGWHGSGGGGLTANGGISGGGGGDAFINGGAGGGIPDGSCVSNGLGGFGGGGAGGNGGGGGGGYSGGAGGYNDEGEPDMQDYPGGGGGGSYNSGVTQTNTSGSWSGDGQVIISW